MEENEVHGGKNVMRVEMKTYSVYSPILPQADLDI